MTSIYTLKRPATHLALALGIGTALTFGPLASALAQGSQPPAVSLTDKLPSFAPLVDHVMPAVVNISVDQRAGAPNDDSDDDDSDNADPGQIDPGGPGTPFDELMRRFFERQQQGRHPSPNQRVTALGSGFIIDPAGFVVTNNHVIGDAEKVTVIFQDDSRHIAKVIGKDAKSDLALLKIDAPTPLPFVKFGDSDKAKVGDWIIAVGNPFGLGGTVTKGIISARGRPIDTSYVDFLQVDASINKGNSGGPTFNTDGDVVGINSAIYSPNGGSVGIGFAIPSNTAKVVLDQLKASGHVDRGFLGVQIQEVTPSIASSIGLDPDHPAGALVSTVNDNSPAAKAGIKVGDVIQKFDGKPVDKMRDLPRIVAETTIGKKVDIVVLRGGKTETVSAVVAPLDDTKVASNQPSDEEKANRAPQLGLYLSSLNADARKRLNIGKDVQGVLVARVKDGSPAAEIGIEAGDVIVQVNNQPIGKPEDFALQVKDVKPGTKKGALLLVNRHGTNHFFAINPEEKKS